MRLRTTSPRPDIAVVLPTCNRPKHVQSVLENLNDQTLKPSVVIVIDSSDSDEIGNQVKRWSHVKYIQSKLKSAAYQRNLGMREILEKHSDCDYISFVDDDIRISNSYLENLSSQLKKNDSIIGVSGVADSENRFGKSRNHSDPIKQKSRIHSKEGKIDSFVINRPVLSSDKLTECTWLIGCSMWRLETLKKENHWFEADFTRQSLFEDAIFSHRFSHKSKLVVDPDISFQHLLEIIERPNDTTHSADWVLHRFRLVSTDSCFGYLGFTFSIFGVLFKSSLRALLRRKQTGDITSKGLILGIMRLIRSL